MSKDCENIYKKHRENAGFTQEEAAELLNISVRALSDYENCEKNNKMPSNNTAAAMAEKYNAPDLVIQHILLECPEFAPYLPEPMKIDNIYHAMIELKRVEKDARETYEELDKISQDVTLTDKERSLYFDVCKKKSS